MHAGVVKLHALADTVRSRAENHDLLAVTWCNLGLAVVARVVVRGFCGEFTAAGVDRLIDRADTEAMAYAAGFRFADSAELGNLRIREPVVFGTANQSTVQFSRVSHLSRDFVDEHDLIEEPRVNLGGLEQLLEWCPLTQRLLHQHDAAIGGNLRRFDQLGRSARLITPMEARTALLQGAQCLLQSRGVVASERHRLTHGLHRGGQGHIGGRELLESEARNLHHHVIEGRLE